VFWLARSTSNGDAKLELLTRTASRLPPLARACVRARFAALAPGGRLEGAVLQLPFEVLAPRDVHPRLISALDFSLGTVAALT
jgi:hypothetical protein